MKRNSTIEAKDEVEIAKKKQKRKEVTDSCQQNFQLAHFGSKGRRKTMEDEYVIFSDDQLRKQFDLPTTVRVCVGGVYDGHGGTNTVKHLKQNLHVNVITAFLEACKMKCPPLPSATKKAILSAFKKTEDEILQLEKDGLCGDGACVVFTLIVNSVVYISNLGDSKAILSRDKKAVALTQDHKPVLLTERQRIESVGGKVQNGRVQGSLEVSRSFGDVNLKKYGVSSEPDVKIHFKIKETDNFLLLACDGLWSKYNKEMAVEFICKKMYPVEGHELPENLINHDLPAICEALVEDAIYKKGCQDNCSVMLVKFHHTSK